MRYAKLIDNHPHFAPNPVLIGDNYVGNPSAAIYGGLGYKPVLFDQMPEPPAGYSCTETWSETEEAVVRGWALVEEGEIPDGEALEILLGGEEA